MQTRAAVARSHSGVLRTGQAVALVHLVGRASVLRAEAAVLQLMAGTGLDLQAGSLALVHLLPAIQGS